MYELRVTSGSNEWIIPFESITITEELNYGVSGTVKLNYLALERYAGLFNLSPDSIFASTLAEWKLYRNGVLFYAGIFNHRKVSGSKTQGTSYSLNLLGYEYLLKSRYTYNNIVWWHTSEDSADIAWDLISCTHAHELGYGDTGITRGLHPTTVDRDKTCRFDNIYDAIVSMSAAKKYNGYDWEVTPQKVFNIYYPKGGVKYSLILDDFNIISWSSDRAIATGLANEVIALGSGFNDDILYEFDTDLASMETWGLQQAVISEKDTSDYQNLLDKARKVLADRAVPKDIIALKLSDRSPDISTYNVGDSLPVKIKAIGFDKLLRIDQRTVQIQRSGEAIVDLSFQYVA